MNKKIGEGRTAEIFALDDNRIAKVFRSHIPDDFIDHELNISEKVQALGLNVPKVYGKEEMNGQSAIIYEKVEGETLLATLVKKPWKIRGIARNMARLHYEMHSKSGEGLPLYREVLLRNIQQAEELSDSEKTKIIKYLEGLSDGGNLCHGDFHPDNVLCSSNETFVIDWTTAVSGDPLADVARTAVILQYAVLPDEVPSPIRLLFRVIRSLLYKNYLSTYIELSRCSLEEINKWKLPIMGARLVENLPQKEIELLQLKIRERLAD
ncbi:MAG TPA: aminoglycoside phosphotransferase family protein [Sporolactobacillaceae bacterium]|nr:aminoglycoside phosphotransferase family protein [Sporolactobacillaceae bacterium]